MKRIIAVLLVALLTMSSVSVMAAKSPVAKNLHKITISGKSVGKKGGSIKVKGGTISVSKGVIEDGKQVTLKAKANKGKKFVKWVIDGDFTIVSGSLTSDTITIIPNGDTDVNAEFEENTNGSGNGTDGGDGENPSKDTQSQPEPVTQAPDNSNISPKTGMNDAAPVVAVLLLSVSGLALSRKRKQEQ